MNPTGRPSRPPNIRLRLFASALLLIGEMIAVTMAVDTGSLVRARGLAGIAGTYGPDALRWLVLALSLAFAHAGFRGSAILVDGARHARQRWGRALAVQLGIFGVFAVCCVLLCRGGDGRNGWAAGAALAGAATVISGGLVFMRAAFWRAVRQSAPGAPWFGMIVAAAVLLLAENSGRITTLWLDLTIRVCHRVFSLLPLPVVFDARTRLLGTPRFQVTIAEQCSGYEGVALILVFSVAWLWFLRRELRFPQALLLVPAGVAASWLLNILRIVVLLLIGNAGAPGVAAGGFHSEAGWISFILLAIGMALAFQRWSWASRPPRTRAAIERPFESAAAANETAAYLAPFLAILAAGIAAHALSANFEWLYPLRVVAAAAALWRYRDTVWKLNWRPGAGAVGIGVGVFLLWIGWQRLSGGAAVAAPAVFTQAPGYLRFAWLASRIAGGVITVPIAEELAFRGYLMRRLTAPDFAAVSFRQTTLLAIAGSSVIFGVLHGGFWAPGVAAGVLYAQAARRRDRLGDAAAAHAVTNALLAACVLYTGQWQLW